MIELILTDEFETRYKELPVHIQHKAERRTALFRHNPFHPTLETEKLHTPKRAVWSFRIDDDYRIIFRFLDGNRIVFLTVGPHHWIYRQLRRFFL